MHWGRDTLAGFVSTKVEIVDFIAHNRRVNHGAAVWVVRVEALATVEARGDHLVDGHEQDLGLKALSLQGVLDLRELVGERTRELRCRQAVSIDNDSFWRHSIHLLESAESS